jgi:Polyketide cyclase / dehydrase and lipid transport
MIKKILLALVILVGGFLAFAASRPADFRITRSATLSAPPAAVFAEVNDFHRWDAWSPWARLDPKCLTTYEGKEFGEGAAFTWSGNSEVGVGRMSILESRPSDLIRISLVFSEPMEADNLTEFTFQPEGTGTRVTWTMTGKNDFMGKVMDLILNCDKMVGSQFEEGFANLQKILAASATSAPKATTEKP